MIEIITEAFESLYEPHFGLQRVKEKHNLHNANPKNKVRDIEKIAKFNLKLAQQISSIKPKYIWWSRVFYTPLNSKVRNYRSLP